MAQANGEATFDVATTPSFTDYQQVLGELVQKKKRKGRQDFCVIGYVHADQSKSAWVFWKQANKLILWEPGDDALNQSRRVIDLKRDVVKTDDDLHGSTYLVTKGWVKQVTDECNRTGVKATLNASRRRT